MSWLICEDIIRHVILKFIYHGHIFDKLIRIPNKRFHRIVIHILQQLFPNEININNHLQNVLQHLNFSHQLRSRGRKFYFSDKITFYKFKPEIYFGVYNELLTIGFEKHTVIHCIHQSEASVIPVRYNYHLSLSSKYIRINIHFNTLFDKLLIDIKEKLEQSSVILTSDIHITTSKDRKIFHARHMRKPSTIIPKYRNLLYRKYYNYLLCKLKLKFMDLPKKLCAIKDRRNLLSILWFQKERIDSMNELTK